MPMVIRRLSSLVLAAALLVGGTSAVVSAVTCTSTGYFEDGFELTAAIVNPTAPVTGTVDATGCNIGVYFGPGMTGSVDDANISGANYYGVLVNGADVDVTDSEIHDIGEIPLNGAQHGDAIAYRNGATGTVSGNRIYSYQKTGILITGAGTSVSVLNNTVTGEGPITYIAQNGIQISYGASAVVRGNTISGNWYTPPDWTACGLLLYQASGVKMSMNRIFDNEANLCNFGRGGGNVKP
jgi:nitrous oxidase accessory protein NosD